MSPTAATTLGSSPLGWDERPNPPPMRWVGRLPPPPTTLTRSVPRLFLKGCRPSVTIWVGGEGDGRPPRGDGRRVKKWRPAGGDHEVGGGHRHPADGHHLPFFFLQMVRRRRKMGRSPSILGHRRRTRWCPSTRCDDGGDVFHYGTPPSSTCSIMEHVWKEGVLW